MSALTINGIALNVAVADAQHSAPIVIGEQGRSFSGKLIDSVRARKEQLKLRTPPLIQNDAIFWRTILQGLGYSWSFDADLYADLKGLGPDASTSGSPTAANAAAKYGKSANVPVGGVLSYTPGITVAAYTVAFWRQQGTAWRHYIFTPNAVWRDGVVYSGNSAAVAAITGGTQAQLLGLPASASAWTASNGYVLGAVIKPTTGNAGGYYYEADPGGTSGTSAPTWPQSPGATVVDGGVTWVCLSTGTGAFDDLAVLPIDVVALGWASALYTAMNTAAWQPNPTLSVAGDLIQAAPRTMEGVLDDATLTPFFSAGVWQDNGEVLAFTLSEV